MRIMVIGSEGNVGRHLVSYLRRMLHDVFCVDIRPGYGKEYLQADINNSADLQSVFQLHKPEVVYCLAAMVGRDTCELAPQMAVSTNIGGVSNVTQLCKSHGSMLIYFSTSEVYGNIEGELDEGRLDLRPNNLYGVTKLLSENLVRYETDRGLKSFIVRPCMLYHEDETIGEHRSAMIRFAEKLVRGEKIDVHTNSSRGWLHMDDAVKAFSVVPFLPEPHIINIGSPHIKFIVYVAEYMCILLGLDPKRYINETRQPSGMTLHKKPSLWKQARLLGFTPEISLEEGIERVINRMKERVYGRKKDM